jgi:hypothetical protein
VSQSTTASAPACSRRLPGGQGVFRVVLVAVEAVFRVVDDHRPVVLQIADGVGDHGEVLVGRCAQHLFDVEQPGLAEDGDHRRLGLEQSDLVVVLDRDAACGGWMPKAAMRAEIQRRRAAWLKNSISLGLEPGQPPSM